MDPDTMISHLPHMYAAATDGDVGLDSTERLFHR